MAEAEVLSIELAVGKRFQMKALASMTQESRYQNTRFWGGGQRGERVNSISSCEDCLGSCKRNSKSLELMKCGPPVSITRAPSQYPEDVMLLQSLAHNL